MIPHHDTVLFGHTKRYQIIFVGEAQALHTLVVEGQLLQELLSIHIENIDQRHPVTVLLTFGRSAVFAISRLSNATESDSRLSEDRLLAGLGILLNQFVVQRVHDSSLVSVPHQVIVNATETIIPINNRRLNSLVKALRLVKRQSFLLDLNFESLLVAHRDEMVVAEIPLLNQVIVVLLEALLVSFVNSERLIESKVYFL